MMRERSMKIESSCYLSDAQSHLFIQLLIKYSVTNPRWTDEGVLDKLVPINLL